MNPEAQASRRSLIKYAFATLGSLIAPAADMPLLSEVPEGYRVIDRRALAGGGVGLFIAVQGNVTRDGLRALGEKLTEDLRDEPNALVEIFDEADAARTVRTGSRLVGEERFAAALKHRRGAFQKNARLGKQVLTIADEPAEIIQY